MDGGIFFFYYSLFGLMLYVPVNSYGHVERVSSPNHTFSWASWTKQLTSRQYFVRIFLLATESAERE